VHAAVMMAVRASAALTTVAVAVRC